MTPEEQARAEYLRWRDDTMESHGPMAAFLFAYRLGARRRISKSELETMAKAIRSAASRGGVSWKDYSEGYRELAIDEAKAACTSVGFEVEQK